MKRNLFNSIELRRPKKNAFDLTHDVKLSCNFGQLVPVMCTEVVPGDKLRISCESLLRFAPLVAPMMHRCDVYIHYFFVPNRILWSNWEQFITNGYGDPAAAFPTINIGASNQTKLTDYLGIPPAIGAETEDVNALPFAAYQAIYNEYYRDQNLVTALNYQLVNGDNSAGYPTLWTLRRRAWEHDYFTASLPTAQEGSAVSLPLGNITLDPAWSGDPIFKTTAGISTGGSLGQDVVGVDKIVQDVTGTPSGKSAYDPDGSLVNDPTTINDLRRAFRLQEWLEKAMRGGSRYVENIWEFFGVRSQDARLQRPEYITGVKTPVNISEVLNTTGTASAPQGNMAGHGIAVTTGNYGKYFVQEHGYVMGIMSVMPKTAYMQGIARHFLKRDTFDFFWPQFAHIGEQEVRNKEIYAFQAGTLGEDTFGYVPRYAEYKFENNRVAGQFRTSLDFWHMARKFSSAPALNQTFIECDPSYRVFAVTDTDTDHLWMHVLNKVLAIRPMPKFGTPSF